PPTPPTPLPEGKPPPPALVTTAGFKFVLEIGRHDIPRHGNLYGWSKPARPVTPEHGYEVTERPGAEGPGRAAARRGGRARGRRRVPPRLREPRPRAPHGRDSCGGVSRGPRLALVGGAAPVPRV